MDLLRASLEPYSRRTPLFSPTHQACLLMTRGVGQSEVGGGLEGGKLKLHQWHARLMLAARDGSI